jgi:ATPase subunit of ABC transporter with duplicated ATPase domains
MKSFLSGRKISGLKKFWNISLKRNVTEKLLNQLRDRNPILLVGSRGVGKSFLMKVAQAELTRDFKINRVLPVYISFTKSSLLQGSDELTFQNWMLSKICSEILRTLRKQGLLTTLPSSLTILAGNEISAKIKKSKIENLSEAIENKWRNPAQSVESSFCPTTTPLKLP